MADAAPVKEEVAIKTEVDGASPMALDDDIYEDAGDLDFWDKTVPNDPYGSMYLARVPQYVWEAWDKLDDDTEIELGKIRTWVDRQTGKVRSHGTSLNEDPT